MELYPILGRLGTGASLLCAQYFGKNNMQAIHAIEGIALRFSIIISGIVALIAFTAPQLMMKIFTSDQELISIGSSYLRIMGITYLCWGITEVYLAILRSIGRVTISMALNMLAFILNIILNATFIFGLFGAPKLGATGVAIATAASRLIELAACVIVSFLSKDVKLNLTFMFIRSKVLFGDFVRLSLPALGNDISWSVAFSMYSVILGHLGTDAVAANSLVTVVRNIGSVFCFAIASAGTILLGNVMGKGDLEKSKVYASRMLKMTIIAGAIGGVIVFAITPLVLRFASLSDGAMHYLRLPSSILAFGQESEPPAAPLVVELFLRRFQSLFSPSWLMKYERNVVFCGADFSILLQALFLRFHGSLICPSFKRFPVDFPNDFHVCTEMFHMERLDCIRQSSTGEADRFRVMIWQLLFYRRCGVFLCPQKSHPYRA